VRCGRRRRRSRPGCRCSVLPDKRRVSRFADLWPGGVWSSSPTPTTSTTRAAPAARKSRDALVDRRRAGGAGVLDPGDRPLEAQLGVGLQHQRRGEALRREAGVPRTRRRRSRRSHRRRRCRRPRCAPRATRAISVSRSGASSILPKGLCAQPTMQASVMAYSSVDGWRQPIPADAFTGYRNRRAAAAVAPLPAAKHRADRATCRLRASVPWGSGTAQPSRSARQDSSARSVPSGGRRGAQSGASGCGRMVSTAAPARKHDVMAGQHDLHQVDRLRGRQQPDAVAIDQIACGHERAVEQHGVSGRQEEILLRRAILQRVRQHAHQRPCPAAPLHRHHLLKGRSRAGDREHHGTGGELLDRNVPGRRQHGGADRQAAIGQCISHGRSSSGQPVRPRVVRDGRGGQPEAFVQAGT
jgi:hypothetical protein